MDPEHDEICARLLSPPARWPSVMELRAGLTMTIDEELAGLMDDVDGSVLAWSLMLSPLERIRFANGRLRRLQAFRRVTPPKEADGGRWPSSSAF